MRRFFVQGMKPVFLWDLGWAHSVDAAASESRVEGSPSPPAASCLAEEAEVKE